MHMRDYRIASEARRHGRFAAIAATLIEDATNPDLGLDPVMRRHYREAARTYARMSREALRELNRIIGSADNMKRAGQ